MFIREGPVFRPRTYHVKMEHCETSARLVSFDPISISPVEKEITKQAFPSEKMKNTNLDYNYFGTYFDTDAIIETVRWSAAAVTVKTSAAIRGTSVGIGMDHRCKQRDSTASHARVSIVHGTATESAAVVSMAHAAVVSFSNAVELVMATHRNPTADCYGMFHDHRYFNCCCN